MVDVKTEREHLRGLEELLSQKRCSDALSIAKKLKDQYPNSFQIRFTYIRVLRELNKLGEAGEELAQLMQSFPNNINLLMEMGKLSTERNKFDDAIEFYNKILFLDPFNTEAKEAIDKLNVIKRRGVQADSNDTGFASYTGEKLHRADTLPELDTEGLMAAMNPDTNPDMEDEPDTRPMESLAPKPPPAISFDDIEEEIEEDVPRFQPPPPPPEPPAISFDDIEEDLEEDIPRFQPPPPPPPPDPEPEPDPPVLSFDDIEEETPGIESGPPDETDTPNSVSSGFVTESAAEIYLKQGLWKDALDIYKKLYETRKDERFLVKINHLKKQLVTRKQIALLTEFLAVVKRNYPYQGQGD